MPTILVVDDELSMREFLKIMLEKEGYRALCAKNGEIALQLATTENPDLVITDIRMPGMGGLNLLEKIKQLNNRIPVIMITAYASPEDAVQAMKNGAYDYITKPFDVEEIKTIINSAIRKAKAVKQTPAGSGAFHGIIGNSSEMLKIFDLVRRIAPTHANVLIYGESGTGKELVTRAIHHYSNVAEHPFVPITCSAIPQDLLESELFGHIKGAFTGAINDKIGLFELANNGTVFLDEIGELTPLIQTKLLRVLQEREVKRVGDTRTIKVNVRIISATNKDLEKEIMAGNFRDDLFYRLAVVPIRIPSLRERREDIPLLIDHFLKKYSKRFNKEVQALSSYALEVLMNYDFPGNVRELENIIERGVALESSNIILPESLSLSAHRRGEACHGHHISSIIPPAMCSREQLFERGLEEIVSDIEKRLIEHALEEANQSKMRAAELLRISFRSLRYKIHKYNMQTPD